MSLYSRKITYTDDGIGLFYTIVADYIYSAIHEMRMAPFSDVSVLAG